MYKTRYELWREEVLLEMADEFDKELVGKWYWEGYGYMELWSPESASNLDSYSNYAGDDMGDYYACIPRNRDSDTLAESNWRVAVKWFTEELGEESEETWLIANWSHWACGWIERILIHKDCWKGIRLGNKIGYDMDNYPILDEDDYSGLEQEQYDKCVTEEFEFRNFTQKQCDRFWEMVRESNTDCMTCETLDYELLDRIETHLWLRKFPVPSEKAEDDEGDVWMHTVTFHECSNCENRGVPGYYRTNHGENPEDTFVCESCIEWEEHMVDENQEKLPLEVSNG